MSLHIAQLLRGYSLRSRLFMGCLAAWRTCNGAMNQMFTRRPVTALGYSKDYRLVVVHSGKCVDVSQISTTADAKIHQWVYDPRALSTTRPSASRPTACWSGISAARPDRRANLVTWAKSCGSGGRPPLPTPRRRGVAHPPPDNLRDNESDSARTHGRLPWYKRTRQLRPAVHQTAHLHHRILLQ